MRSDSPIQINITRRVLIRAFFVYSNFSCIRGYMHQADMQGRKYSASGIGVKSFKNYF